MKKVSLFLLFSFLCVLIVFIVSTDLRPQGDMRVNVETADGEEIAFYKDSYALVIGNGSYAVKNGWTPLPGAVADAKEVAEVLERHGFEVSLQIDVTKAEFNKAFSAFIYESGKDKDNRLLFYYAGHGSTTEAATGEALDSLVMLDTPSPENSVEFDLYSVDLFKFVLDSKKIRAKHVLFMFDSCLSGGVLNLSNRVTSSQITERINSPVRQFIIGGCADASVPSRRAFKKAFLDLLEGRVEEPTPDGYLTGVELGNYLRRTVPKFSQGQHPQYGKIDNPQLNSGDFVFVLPQGIELSTMAVLNITSTPGNARVYVDGVLIGTTPLRGYQIDTGVRLEKQVNVGLELSGYKSRVKKVILKGGQQFPWDVDLERVEREASRPKQSVPKTTVEEDSGANEEKTVLSGGAPQTIVGTDGAEMVLIPAGDFQMGRSNNSNSRPVHTVYVDAFYIDKYEVTVGQYNRFVRATRYKELLNGNYRYSRTDQHPVVGVSWHDAMAYAKWAGKRLPTEAEWEKAARGGLVGQQNPWGNTAVDGTQCNFADISLGSVWNDRWGDDWTDKNISDGYGHAAPVGSYPANRYGLYDMAGNVWEWCFDAYDENFYANSPRRNPVAPIIVKDGANNIVGVNKLRVKRGGSWFDRPVHMGVYYRSKLSPGEIVIQTGFRCVKSVDP